MDGNWTYNEIVIDTDAAPGNPFGLADPALHAFGQVVYVGNITHGGETYPVIYSGGGNAHYVLFHDVSGGPTGASAAASWHAAQGASSFTIDSGTGFTECFAEGTKIFSANGEVEVQNLEIGDSVATINGGETKVLWVGYQDVFPLLAQERDQPVRIRAGALGNNLPSEDLIVTADHALVVDGLLINASALVNHDTIDFMPASEMPRLRVFHVETENHDIILANGCPAESYLSTRDRSSFANYQEYLDLYGADRIVPESDLPRISSRRLLPETVKSWLGIGDGVTFAGEKLTA